eukprot:SAG11_NODE_4707_length_1797_cov_1.153121_3_plen_166_part_00
MSDLAELQAKIEELEQVCHMQDLELEQVPRLESKIQELEGQLTLALHAVKPDSPRASDGEAAFASEVDVFELAERMAKHKILLAKVPLFVPLTDHEQLKIASKLKSHSYTNGQVCSDTEISTRPPGCGHRQSTQLSGCFVVLQRSRSSQWAKLDTQCLWLSLVVR